MNIGFYGKGGSGKSTLSSFFSLYLDSQGYRVGLLDVDVNAHTAELLNANSTTNNVVDCSEPLAQIKIREFLTGSNRRVTPVEFLNTTPPGGGSGFWTFDPENYISRTYGQGFGQRSFIVTTGTYTAEQIGVDCHHSTQMIAENMISHSKLEPSDALIVDSVAGTDAFGTSLYLNDILVFVVKPEREGLSVLSKFLALAEKAEMLHRVVVIANQVSSEAQREFITRGIDTERLLGILDINETIQERRLNDQPIDLKLISSTETVVFEKLISMMQQIGHDSVAHYNTLVSLHRRLSQEGWVIGSYRAGIEDQIDLSYQPS